MNDKELGMKLLKLNGDEYNFIEKLRSEGYVFSAVITEDFAGTVYSCGCELILQKESLKIIKYDLDKKEWMGNSYIYYKAIDFSSSIVTSDANLLKLNIGCSVLLFNFNDVEVLFECYKEITRKINMYKNRRFL